MILNNVTIAGSGARCNISISSNGLIRSLHNESDACGTVLDFEDALVFPGLINSHDHPDFNLFPRLGDRVYSNYTEWGKYIHSAYRPQIEQVMKVPIALRALWGIYKNLLCGVTTVVNQGDRLNPPNDLISVFEQSQCIHSVGFDHFWPLRLNNPAKFRLAVNIHVGEGTDSNAYSEIGRLISFNLFRRPLIGVHGVAMSQKQAKKFKALVWCPDSNYFLFNKTADVSQLKKHTAILFGTDSCLTASWNIWEHLRLARSCNQLTDLELYSAVTKTASQVWGLNAGEIAPGRDADLVIARPRQAHSSYAPFFSLNPEDILLVMQKGRVRLFDVSLSPQLTRDIGTEFSKIVIGGAVKYVYGDLPGLMEQIQQYYPNARFPVAAATYAEPAIL